METGESGSRRIFVAAAFAHSFARSLFCLLVGWLVRSFVRPFPFTPKRTWHQFSFEAMKFVLHELQVGAAPNRDVIQLCVRTRRMGIRKGKTLAAMDDDPRNLPTGDTTPRSSATFGESSTSTNLGAAPCDRRGAVSSSKRPRHRRHP